MEQPILSICIPTINRSKYLKKNLDTIVKQKAFLDGRVEVVISDNASTDDTKAIGTEYADKYENIRYYRNEKNISNDNFPLVISKANGIYRRLCNDTLLFKDDSLNVMCKIIESNQNEKPFLVWTSGRNCTEFYKTNFEGYLHTMSFWITSIACFGIWGSDCDGIAEDTYGTALLLWQVRKGLELANKTNKVLIVNKDLTGVQDVKKKNISYGLYKIFYKNYFLLLQPYFDSGTLSAETREFLEKDLLFNFFMDWTIKWEFGAKNLQYSKTEDLKEAVHQQYKDKDYWQEYCRQYKRRRIIVRLKETKDAVGRLIRR